MKNISIGIMAYNEEGSIAETIRSIFEQDVLDDGCCSQAPAYGVELIVVPNGCNDRTAEVARNTVAQEMAEEDRTPSISVKICELEEPGKENAWNHFVHEFSSPESEYLILMDADVRLEHPSVLRSLVDALTSNPEAVVAGGLPVKHIELQSNKSIFDRVSIGATTLRWGMKGTLAGCLYCGHSDVLRSFRLPTVLMGEDSFVRAMIVTKGFTQQDDPDRIVRVNEARVIFEAYTTPAEIVRNKTRRMLEASIDAILYTKLWAESTPQIPAGDLIKRWDGQDQRWSQRLVQNEFDRRGFWKVPKYFIYSQFLQLQHHPWPKRFMLLPVALATLPLNFLAAFRANQMVAHGEIRQLWDKAV